MTMTQAEWAKKNQEDRRSLRIDTKPPVTAEQLRELRAEGIEWSVLEQRFQRYRGTLRLIMAGKKKAWKRKAEPRHG
jgi:hypothetical protein